MARITVEVARAGAHLAKASLFPIRQCTRSSMGRRKPGKRAAVDSWAQLTDNPHTPNALIAQPGGPYQAVRVDVMRIPQYVC